MKRTSAVFMAVALVLFGAVQARAGVIEYTNQAAFSAASTSLTSTNFVGLAPAGSYSYYGNFLAVGALTFTTPGSNLFVIDPGFSSAWDYGTGRPVLTDNFGGGSGLTTNLPAGTTAVGFLIGDFGPNTATLTLSTGDVFLFNLTGLPTLDFVGFTSTVPITSVTFQDQIQAPVIDTVLFGLATVPEPASLTLFGLITAGGAIYGWRRRKQVVVA